MTEPHRPLQVVDRGQLSSRAGWVPRGLALSAAGLLWLVLFLVLPILAVLALAFASRGDYGELIWRFTWDNCWRLLGYGDFGWSADMLVILARSTALAVATTLVALAVAYPLAFLIAARPPRQRALLLAVVSVPFCISVVIRTYGWMLLCSNQLPLARLAAWLQLIEPGSALSPSAPAVWIGMVNIALPFALLPLYPSVERIDWSLVEAAQDCYASRWLAFRHGILPQTYPGLAAGFLLTVIPALGTLVVSDLLGGAKYMLVGNLIQQQFGASHDWPFGAALCLGLILLSIAGIALMRRWRAVVLAP
jgi:spermidine/putrescine transport system permease protein